MSFSKSVAILVCVVVFESLAIGSFASNPDRKADETPGAKGVPVFNPVEGRTRVILIKPEGSWVKPGEMVCLLDSRPLKDRLGRQELAVEAASARYQKARRTREAAE